MSRRFAVAVALLVPIAYQGNAPVTSRFEGGPRRATPPLATVSLGTEHGCGLTADGRAYCWGSNRLGQLGDEDVPVGTRPIATPVAVATAETFVSISAGANHTCALTRAGAAYCWGINESGELGQAFVANDCGGFPCNRRPVRVETTVRFDAISAGYGHTCALSGGRAFCWGRNDRGQLGSTRAEDLCEGVACNIAPVRAGELDAFTSISAGGDHTCGIAGGVAYCWGSNQYGQLGVETRGPNNPRPLRVTAAEGLVALEAKGIRTCGRTERAREVCWGGSR